MAVFQSALLRASVPAPAPVLKLPVALRKERIPTNRRICNAGGTGKKGVVAFCRVEAGIASVGGRNVLLAFAAQTQSTPE